MARTAMSFEDKVKNAVNGEPSESQNEFATWLREVTGLKIDIKTLVASQRLYNEYRETPEAQERAAARKANAESKKGNAEQKKRERAAKLAAELGFSLVPVEESDAE